MTGVHLNVADIGDIEIASALSPPHSRCYFIGRISRSKTYYWSDEREGGFLWVDRTKKNINYTKIGPSILQENTIGFNTTGIHSQRAAVVIGIFSQYIILTRYSYHLNI